MEENNSNVANQRERKVIRISRKKIIRFFVTVIILCGLLWVINLLTGTFNVGPTQVKEEQIPYISGHGVSITSDSVPSFSLFSKSKISNRYYQEQAPTIEDTREFIKTSYSSDIITRKVQETVTHIKNIIAGADGRVDRFSSNEKYGYIQFIVEKSKFEDLRSQVSKLVNAKLYAENISGENLLTQKQDIEQQTTTTINNLDELNNQLASLEKSHTQNVSAINKQLNSIKSQLVSIRANIATTNDPSIITSLRSQETLLLQQEATQNTKLYNENKSYNTQKQNLNNEISAWNDNLTYIGNQDMQFTNNIETVNGYVSVSWISHWELIKIFSPIHPTLIIIILIIISFLSLRHKRFIPKVIVE